MIIKFDKKSLNISSKGNITGVITLAIDNLIFFPERNWNDTIVVILISWINNVNQLLSGKVSEERFFFFDGPFMFVIRKSEEQQKIDLFQGSKLIGVYEMDIYKFRNHLISVSKGVLKEIKNKNWNTKDIDELEEVIKKLS